MAYMVCFSLNPVEERTTLPTLMMNPALSPVQGTCIEAILTFNLLFVILSVTNPRSKNSSVSNLSIAFCFGCGIMAAVREIPM